MLVLKRFQIPQASRWHDEAKRVRFCEQRTTPRLVSFSGRPKNEWWWTDGHIILLGDVDAPDEPRLQTKEWAHTSCENAPRFIEIEWERFYCDSRDVEVVRSKSNPHVGFDADYVDLVEHSVREVRWRIGSSPVLDVPAFALDASGAIVAVLMGLKSAESLVPGERH